MPTKPNMPPKFVITLFGYILFPMFFLFLFLWNNPMEYNYTGLLNQESTRYATFTGCIAGGIWLVYVISYLSIKNKLKNRKIYLFIFIVCLIAAAFLPYSKTGDIFSQLHLLAAVFSFLIMNAYILYFIRFNHRCITIYTAMMFAVFLLIITFQSVTRTAEMLYAIVTAGLLTYLYRK